MDGAQHSAADWIHTTAKVPCNLFTLGPSSLLATRARPTTSHLHIFHNSLPPCLPARAGMALAAGPGVDHLSNH